MNEMIIKPIHEFILKISSICNLNCDYCYEYNLGDSSWKTKSKIMGLETAKVIAEKIKKHVELHNIPNIFISFHGGEPLLVSINHFEQIILILKTELFSSNTRVTFSTQTNCTLINEEFIKLFEKYQINIGISIDGSKKHNDLHRVGFRGESTFEKVKKGIDLVNLNAPNLIGGVLTVIDLKNDPIEVFDFIATLGINNVDFLLPHYNHDNLPPRYLTNQVEYGDWYYKIWKEWIKGRNKHLNIRFLENIVLRLAGKEGIYEQMTLSSSCMIVIDSDGNLEGVDTLKSTASGVQNLNMNLYTNSFEEVISSNEYKYRQYPYENIINKCKNCEVTSICVGGYLPHRFKAENDFNNESIFCTDLFYLIKKMQGDIINAITK